MSQTTVDVVPSTLYAPGTPLWVDLASPDLPASKQFYGQLFGWQADTSSDPQAGGYTLFTLRGKMVAAVGPIFDSQQPPAWATYVASADADATARAVREAGGQIVVEPMDVMDQGRMAVCVDSGGAFFSVWQPRKHQGAEIVNEPNSFSWNELATRDLAGARTFYKAVFGWESETHPMGQMGSYTEWKLNGRSIGGAMEMGDRFPATVPPHWLTYFTVSDCDATVAKAQQLGGATLVPPMDIPQGRFAVLSDSQGAAFAVMGPSQG